MDVVRDDRDGNPLVVTLRDRVVEEIVDRKHQIRRRLVKELDPLTLGREHRRHARERLRTFKVKPGRCDRIERLTLKAT